MHVTIDEVFVVLCSACYIPGGLPHDMYSFLWSHECLGGTILCRLAQAETFQLVCTLISRAHTIMGLQGCYRCNDLAT